MEQPAADDATLQTDADAMRVARMSTVYRQMPLTLGAGIANALLTAVVLAPLVSMERLLVWLAAVVLVSAGRLWSLMAYRRMPDRCSIRVWERFSMAGALASGALWGVLSTVLMPDAQPYAGFVAFIVGGMCAGATTFNSPHLPTVMLFVLPAVWPLTVVLALRGTRLDTAMSAMSAIFAVSLLLTATRFGQFFDQSMRTRLDLAKRTDALAAANERLRAEMDERQATEAALRHAQKMEAVGNLTAGVAHDINNVLMAISGSAELLKVHTTGHPQDDALLESIFMATERGARLTRHLLAFARKEVLDPAIVDINAVLSNLSSLLAATLGRTIRVDLRLRPDVWPVYVDRNEIERAILNLAINARDAMPDGGTLTLATDNVERAPQLIDGSPEGPCVMVTVRDTGIGMPPDVMERAFDPFFTTKPAGRGSGLGLSQVYGLVKQSGGATQIESRPGEGSAIRLYLPKAALPDASLAADRDPATPADAAGPAQGHVVVVDDEAMVADVVSGMLRQAGYRVSVFATGLSALACVEADASVTALVADLGLPDCRGDEVARLARRTRPALPVVFITGYNESGPLANEPWQLRKPFPEAELLSMLRRAIAAGAPPLSPPIG